MLSSHPQPNSNRHSHWNPKYLVKLFLVLNNNKVSPTMFDHIAHSLRTVGCVYPCKKLLWPMTILQKSVQFNAVCWSFCLPCQFVLQNKLIWPISKEVNVCTVHFSWPVTASLSLLCIIFIIHWAYLKWHLWRKRTPVVSPPAMTVAKHEMCHSGALKPMMHTEWDFFRPRWINAFARLRT